MSSLKLNIVDKPLEILDAAFQAQLSHRSKSQPRPARPPTSATDELKAFNGSAEVLRHLLHPQQTKQSGPSSTEEDLISRIPLLQSSDKSWKLLPGTLVRYVGMVQDMLEPEYYSSAVRLVHKTTKEEKIVTGKYRDMDAPPLKDYEFGEEMENTLGTRQLLYCVPVRFDFTTASFLFVHDHLTCW